MKPHDAILYVPIDLRLENELQDLIDAATQINASPIERAFCSYAHAKARGDLFAPRHWQACQFLRDGCACGLCTSAACLFLDPLAPEWSTIHRSVALENGHDDTT